MTYFPNNKLMKQKRQTHEKHKIENNRMMTLKTNKLKTID